MALLFEKEIGFARIAIWEATESCEQLMRMAGDVVTDPGFATITSEKRQFEWLAVRVLLRLMVGSEIKLDYLPDGAPVLAGNPSRISISHTGKYIAVILHPDHRCGIDIEMKNRSVERVARRFLSAEEWANCSKSVDCNRMMLLHWCAKEAAFKMIPHSDIDFAQHINLMAGEFYSAGGALNGSYLKGGRSVGFEVKYFIFDELIIAWCSAPDTIFE